MHTHLPIQYAMVHVVMLSKKQHTVEVEGLVNEGRHRLHKQPHDKRGIAESLHGYITIGLD